MYEMITMNNISVFTQWIVLVISFVVICVCLLWWLDGGLRGLFVGVTLKID